MMHVLIQQLENKGHTSANHSTADFRELFPLQVKHVLTVQSISHDTSAKLAATLENIFTWVLTFDTHVAA